MIVGAVSLLNSVNLRRFALIAACMAASGCVSSTLDSNQFRAVGSGTRSTAATASQIEPTVDSTSSAAPLSLSQQNAVESAPGVSGVPDGTANAANPQTGQDPQARARAIAEMRAKAANSSGVKTQFGAVPEPATEALSAREQLEMKRDLSGAAATDVVSDSELAAKQESIQRLKKKAKQHYSEALDKIEN